MSKRPRVGVIGAGHWGPNLIRFFHDSRDVDLQVVCDRDEARRRAIAGRYPGVPLAADADAVLRADDVDAVVIATPSATHADLTEAALRAGKHVLVEKPMATTPADAARLVEVAAECGRVLMSGHVFLYNDAVRELKRISDDEDFGGVTYMYSRRTNLGPVRADVHAGWDLAAHDISIFLYLMESAPVRVTASAQNFIRSDVADVVFATLYFADGTVGHLHTSWLDPQKVRQVVVVGGHRMAAFDDMNLMEPVRIFNKSYRRVAEPAGEEVVVDSFGAFRVDLISGSVIIPPLSTGEPLRNECQAFLDAIASGTPPLSDGRLGLDVVRVLDAMDRSMARDSRAVDV